jgi:hypothetical protein
MVRVAYLIQHHPSRIHLTDRLVTALPTAQVIADKVTDPPDPWRGYRKCLEAIPKGFTHACIIQDDAIPAAGFADAAVRIAARHPDTPTCLFLGAFPASTASRVRRAKPDVRYVPLGPTSFMPLVAVLWPAHVARSFLDWSTTARGMTRADDGNAARWMKTTRQQVLVAVPSIVQHDDGQPSVKGGRDHVPWAEKWRQALVIANDASNYEW